MQHQVNDCLQRIAYYWAVWTDGNLAKDQESEANSASDTKSPIFFCYTTVLKQQRLQSLQSNLARPGVEASRKGKVSSLE